MPNGDDAAVQVEVGPPEREQFTLPEPGPDRGYVERRETVIGDRHEEGPHLLDRQVS